MKIQYIGIFLGVSSVFLYGYTLPGVELNLFLGVLVLIMAATTFTLSNRPILIQRDVLIGLLVVLAVGSIGILLGRGSMSSYLTQAVAISLVVICSTVVVSGAGEHVVKIFPTYLTLSFAFALIAVFELVLGLFGIYFEFLTSEIDYVFANFHRISGLADEPSHYVFIMTPSVIAILVSTFLNRPCMPKAKSLVIVASYILTFSSVGFFMLAVVFLSLLFRRSSFSSLAVKAVLAATVVGIFAVVPQVNSRVLDTYDVFAMSNPENINLSSLTLYKNFVVTLSSVAEQPSFGAGLGGHEHNYFKYLPDALLALDLNLNEKDAGSMFLRLLSEFGVPFSVILYLYLISIWTGFPARNDSGPVFWKKLTSTAVLGLIIANSARGGNYINNGFPFFIILYYSVHSSLKSGAFRNAEFRPAATAKRPL